MENSVIEKKQKDYYNRIADLYDEHHNNKYALIYRDRFAYRYLYKNLDLVGKNCLDAMCGGGEWTEYLKARGANVTGMDISESCCDIYKKRFPEGKIICGSILKTEFPDKTFELVVTDSLHHTNPKAEEAINEIYRILKPGGYFCFWEPYAGSLMDIFRKIWYKNDSYFADNEGSINLREIKNLNRKRFVFNLERYGGNLAYLLVVCSMIFRINSNFNRYYAKPLFFLEKIFSPFQFKFNSIYVLGRWQKK